MACGTHHIFRSRANKAKKANTLPTPQPAARVSAAVVSTAGEVGTGVGVGCGVGGVGVARRGAEAGLGV